MLRCTAGDGGVRGSVGNVDGRGGQYQYAKDSQMTSRLPGPTRIACTARALLLLLLVLGPGTVDHNAGLVVGIGHCARSRERFFDVDQVLDVVERLGPERSMPHSALLDGAQTLGF